ncbi:MAG: glycosyltransferase, partial [Holophaga sp.]|nr:glycosyltransferase [Holophaga sp.]
MQLLVVIPTWNRAEQLDMAIQAISEARSLAKNCTVELFVSDNCSSDATPEILARWQGVAPWIHVWRWEQHVTIWAQILERALLHSNLEYDYLWLQGDDDWITDSSAYSRLAEALEASVEDPPALVHCCPTRRALPGEGVILGGTTEDLCNTYGWHDLLGWMSSLVIARDTVDRMMASPQWKFERPSVLIHSEALLEAAYGRTMLILSKGFIDPQDAEQTEASKERWGKGNLGEAHWNIIPGLLNLKHRGVLTTPLTLSFFRYITCSLWDRHSGQIMVLAANYETP